MREGIAKNHGYEINTEGDSFHVAFTSVADAVLFAMETQYRLLDTDWPKNVLKLPSCKEVGLSVIYFPFHASASPMPLGVVFLRTAAQHHDACDCRSA
jgi:hypothetical protein